MTLSFLLVPPTCLPIAAALGLVAWRCRAGRLLAAGSLALLVLLSLPVVADALILSLDVAAHPGQLLPQTIVVLGGDLVPDAASPLRAQPGGFTLERLREAAALQRRTSLPLLVSGGAVLPGAAPVADVMARSLRNDFGVPVRWTEDRSADTWQNAQNSASLLANEKISSIFVVTNAWHMRRALIAFTRTNLDVTPASVRRDPAPDWAIETFLPHPSAWVRSYDALHEWIGCAWYRLRAGWSRG